MRCISASHQQHLTAAWGGLGVAFAGWTPATLSNPVPVLPAVLGHRELVLRGRIQPSVPAQFPLEKFAEEFQSMWVLRYGPRPDNAV